MSDQGSTSEEGDETAGVEGHDDKLYVTVNKRRKYPYAAIMFTMMASMGLGFTTGGMITTVEFYFTHFLYVCFGELTTGLGTASVNLFLTLGLLSAVYSGFQADRLLGSFVTHNINYIFSVIGSILFVFSTWLYTLTPPTCCYHKSNSTESGLHVYDKICKEIELSIITKITSIQAPPMLIMTLALLGLAMFAVGNGQLWLHSVFIGEQFNEKEQAMDQQRAFSCFYFWMTFGTLAGELSLPILRQSTGYVISYLIVSGVAFITMVVFMSGRRFYVKNSPKRMACLSTCCSNRGLRICVEEVKLVGVESTGEESDINEESDESDTKQLSDESYSITEKVATSSQTQANSDQDKLLETQRSNKTKDSNQRKMKQLIPLLKIFVPQSIFWAVFFQRSSTFILQAAQMDCYISSLHVPPDVMPSTEDIMVLLLVPILEYILYPHLRRTMGIQVKPMHKLICGMVAVTLGLVLAGLLQIYITEPSKECHGAVSIAWQLPQLFLVSIADVLVGITGLEVAYSLAPPDLRNSVTALSLITQAFGTLLNAVMALIPMSLLISFFVNAAMMTVTTILFTVMNRNISGIVNEQPSAIMT